MSQAPALICDRDDDEATPAVELLLVLTLLGQNLQQDSRTAPTLLQDLFSLQTTLVTLRSNGRPDRAPTNATETPETVASLADLADWDPRRKRWLQRKTRRGNSDPASP